MVSKKEEGIEHLNYVSYEELTELDSNEKQETVLGKVINNLIEVVKWNINFEALIFLRRLNKYHSNIVKQILPKIEKSINKLSNSIRSGIVVECLMFLNELFSQYCIEQEDNDIKTITPFVAIALHSIFHSKAFIKNQAKQLLMNTLGDNKTFANFSFCVELIVQMKNDKPIISDTAFDLYQKLIAKINSYNSVIASQWPFFFNSIDLLYDKKREIYIKKAVKIIKDLQDIISIYKFNSILKECGLEKNIETYESWLKLREKKNTNHISIADFKKQVKQKKEEEEKEKGEEGDNMIIDDK